MKAIPTSLAVKPLLSGTRTLVAGYSALHDQEARYTAIALKEQPEIVAVWYRYLRLYDQAIRGEHECEAAVSSPEYNSWEAKLRFLGTAISSTKLCLDAALAGYYSQAYGLTRYMLKTWKAVAYVRVVPQAAINWFLESGGRPQVPDPTTVDKGIRNQGDTQEKHNLKIVLKYIGECNAGSHPSVLALSQVETGKIEFSQLGANYIEHLLVSVMSLGTLATALLLDEVQKVVKVEDGWREEFDSIASARTLWSQHLAITI